MRPWWGAFLNWLNSPQGWIFYALVSVFIVSILANLVAYARVLRERGAERVGLGRLLAIVGGVITLVALTLLPWESYTPLSCPECGGSLNGFGVEPFLPAISVLVVGLMWFTFFGIPKRVAAVLGLAWGSLALPVAILTFARISADAAASSPPGVYTIEYGVYVAIVGPIVLIIGSALAYIGARQILPPEPIRSDLVVPPIS